MVSINVYRGKCGPRRKATERPHLPARGGEKSGSRCVSRSVTGKGLYQRIRPTNRMSRGSLLWSAFNGPNREMVTALDACRPHHGWFSAFWSSSRVQSVTRPVRLISLQMDASRLFKPGYGYREPRREVDCFVICRYGDPGRHGLQIRNRAGDRNGFRYRSDFHLNIRSEFFRHRLKPAR